MADNFIQEMDEERKIQRLRSIMRHIGIVLIALILIGGIIGSIWGWNKHHLHKLQLEASEHYMQALTLLNKKVGDNDPSYAQNQAQARHIFEDLVAHAPEGIAAFAEMRLADLAYKEGDRKKALSLWQDISHKSDIDESLKGLAQYLWLNHQEETLAPEKQRQFYQEMIKNGGSWALLARASLVDLDLRADGSKEQKQEAKRLLVEIISSPDTSDDLRQRAQLLLHILGDDQ